MLYPIIIENKMTYKVPAIAAGIVVLAIVLMVRAYISPDKLPMELDEHTYTTTTPLEFDKCCAMWLIHRFIDPNAVFKVYPLGTYLSGQRAFDVGGAAWSRQHRKCTSDCIWEDLDVNDVSAERIVQMAHQIELNRWQLDQFPQAQQADDELRQIIEQTPDPNDCIKRTIEYFDALYARLKAGE